MIDTQQQYIKLNIRGEILIIVVQEKRCMHINVHTHMRGEGDEREHIHISGDSSPICKRHLESMLKGIKSYLCLVQTGHVDIEEFRKGRDAQHVILFGTWKGIRAFG
jgi:hypothetical protein